MQTDDVDSTEVTPRLGARFHLFSRRQLLQVAEQAPQRRIVVRDLVRVESRNFFYSGGDADNESTFRFRNRLEFLLPLNKASITDDGARYWLADWEWFVPLDDPEERFANRQRIRTGIGYRRSFNWRYELLYIWTRSRDTLDERVLDHREHHRCSGEEAILTREPQPAGIPAASSKVGGVTSRWRQPWPSRACWWRCGGRGDAPSSPTQAAPAFVGAQACASCHADAIAQWAISDHHEAMQVANSSTVKGDFSGARFTYGGVESSFSVRGRTLPRPHRRPRRPARRLRREVRLRIPPAAAVPARAARRTLSGAQRVVGLARPRRRAASGGSTPTRTSRSIIATSCTGPRCRRTGTTRARSATPPTSRRTTAPETKTYATTWSEINVSCEACHGPGSAHVAWAGSRRRGPRGRPVEGARLLDARHLGRHVDGAGR